MTDIPSVNDTARSLLAFFGTMAEWGERGTIGVHGASPELMALVCAVLDIVPAAWHPYSMETDSGWVMLYQSASVKWQAEMGSYDRGMAVHSVPRPPRYVEPDDAQPVSVAVDQAVVAALVGLASMNLRGCIAVPAADVAPFEPRWWHLTQAQAERHAETCEVEELAIVNPSINSTWAVVAREGHRRSNGHGCARVMATLTDEDIAKAEQDDLGGEGG